MASERVITVGKLGSAVTIAYASAYYLLAILANDIAQSLGLATSTVFLSFFVALMVSAALEPIAGRLVDHYGGRMVLASTSLIFAAGLSVLSAAQGPLSLFAAWMLIGVAMSSDFYEGAFSTLVRMYGSNARSAITGITLTRAQGARVCTKPSRPQATERSQRFKGDRCLGSATVLHLQADATYD